MCRSLGRLGKFYICFSTFCISFSKFYLSGCVVRVAALVNFTFASVPFALASVNFTYRKVARVVAKKHVYHSKCKFHVCICKFLYFFRIRFTRAHVHTTHTSVCLHIQRCILLALTCVALLAWLGGFRIQYIRLVD